MQYSTNVATMCYVATLGGFLRNELQRRDQSPEEFARRCIPAVSTTLIYQIMNGQDNVKRSTFSSIAAALGMTTVELEIATGGGSVDLSPDEVEMLAHYRRVEPEKRSTALSLLHALGVGPTQRRSIGRQDGASTRRKATLRKLNERRANGPNLPDGPDYTVDTRPDSFVPGRSLSRTSALVASIAAL